jgi:large subunit ribosomal protein L5
MKRVQEHYKSTVVPALMKEFKYSTPMQVPRLLKIVLNVGIGETTSNSKAVDFAVYGLTQISGQKPMVTRSKKAIAAFKLRENLPIGCMVTLRREKMYSFFDRLVSVALPRVRDFRGTPTRGFDGRGNYTMGIKEQIVFPEIVTDKLDKIRGMDVTFVTTAKTDEEGRALLTHLGLPFRKATTEK